MVRRSKLCRSSAILLAAVLLGPGAEAQTFPLRTELAVGYNVIPYFQGVEDAFPAGWIVAFSSSDDDSPFGFIAEAAGVYSLEENERRVYTVMGGLRLMPSGVRRVRPFVQFGAGIMILSCCGESYPYFAIEPGGGVQVVLSRRLSVRLAGSVPMAFEEGEAARAVRIQTALAFGWNPRNDD
jgi:hypothetical protein